VARGLHATRGKESGMRMMCSPGRLLSKFVELSDSRSESELSVHNVLISVPHEVLAEQTILNCFIDLCIIIAYAI
jgi:hypothetical protein